MNAKGIVPTLEAGLRTPFDQNVFRDIALRRGANPASQGPSWHQAGGAVDIRGIQQGATGVTATGRTMIAIMQAQGFRWGGSFGDRPHFDGEGFMGNRERAVAKAEDFWIGGWARWTIRLKLTTDELVVGRHA
jgi:hypothetical protein